MDESDDAMGKLLMWVGIGLGLCLVLYGLPVSLYCIGAGILAFVFRVARTFGKDRDGSSSLKRRILVGLLTDSRRTMLLVTLGLALLWVMQIWLNLFGHGANPESIGGAMLDLYDQGDRLYQLMSLKVMASVVFLALFCSVMASTLWPLILLGYARKALAAIVVVVGTMSSFSFAAGSAASVGYTDAIAPVRAAIAGDLNRLARIRSEQAALQWLAAEFTREFRAEARPGRAWRAYFDAVGAACRPRPDCDPDELGVLLARQRASPAATSASVEVPSISLPTIWLDDFRGSIDPHAPGALDLLSDLAAGPHSVSISERVRRLSDLDALRTRVAAANVKAAASRDTLRGLVVEAVGELLGPRFEGIAGRVVDVWRDSLLDAMASEGEARLARRARALNTRVADFFNAPQELAQLVSDVYPIESPAAAESAGRIRETVEADWHAMYVQETRIASPTVNPDGSVRAPAFDEHRPSRAPSETYRPPPQPHPPSVHRPARIPFR